MEDREEALKRVDELEWQVRWLQDELLVARRELEAAYSLIDQALEDSR